MSVLPLPHAGPYASGQPHHWRHQPGQLCILGRLCWLERRSGHKSCTVTADNTQLENLWFTKSSFLWHHDPCQINLKLMIELPQLIKVNLEVKFLKIRSFHLTVFNKTKKTTKNHASRSAQISRTLLSVLLAAWSLDQAVVHFPAGSEVLTLFSLQDSTGASTSNGSRFLSSRKWPGATPHSQSGVSTTKKIFVFLYIFPPQRS